MLQKSIQGFDLVVQPPTAAPGRASDRPFPENENKKDALVKKA